MKKYLLVLEKGCEFVYNEMMNIVIIIAVLSVLTAVVFQQIKSLDKEKVPTKHFTIEKVNTSPFLLYYVDECGKTAVEDLRPHISYSTNNARDTSTNKMLYMLLFKIYEEDKSFLSCKAEDGILNGKIIDVELVSANIVSATLLVQYLKKRIDIHVLKKTWKNTKFGAGFMPDKASIYIRY